MKNILVYCNTYYQLLVAIQLQLTLKGEDKVSVLLTDASRGAEDVAARLKQTGFFHNVFFLHTKVAAEQINMAYKLRIFWGGVFGSTPQDMPCDYVCDELIGFNLDLSTQGVYAALYRRNPHIECHTMEEGLLSYEVPESSNGLMNTICKVRRFLGKKNLRASVQKFYCFNPQAYGGTLTPVLIPRMDCQNAQLKSLLQQIFLGQKSLEAYMQKYIYLPCIYDIEGGEPIGELALAKRLADQVGKDNLIVNVHPRDDAEKYRAAGLAVDTNSSVPFEVLCILQDLSQKILITTLSGSVLNVSALLTQPPTCYYAHSLCRLEANTMAQHFCGVVTRYLNPDSGLNMPNIQLLENTAQLLEERN